MKKPVRCSILCAALLWWTAGVSMSEEPADTLFSISGVVTNYRTDRTIFLGIFTCEKSFAAYKPYQRLRFQPHQLPPDTLPFRFTDVAPGEYIIAAYQDLNCDNKLNRGLFGPTEPYRVYKPNYGLFGPKFSQCKFQVRGDVSDAHIELK